MCLRKRRFDETLSTLGSGLQGARESVDRGLKHIWQRQRQRERERQSELERDRSRDYGPSR